MSQDEKDAPKRPPRPMTSIAPRPLAVAPEPVKESPPPPPVADVAAPPVAPSAPSDPAPDEIDELDLISDEPEVIAPSPAAPARASEGRTPVSRSDPTPSNPFLLADAPHHGGPAAAAPSVKASPHGMPEPTVPAAQPAPREDLASFPKKRSRALPIAFLLVAAATIGGVFAYRAKRARDEQARATSVSEMPGRGAESAAPPPPSNYVEPAPPPTLSSPPPPEKSAAARGSAKIPAARAPEPAASVPPGESGVLDTTQLPAGRKIIVNGRVVGFSPRRVTVRCGTLRIQVGDLPPENIALPCGGEVSFSDD